jgi:hypothetical protein
VNRPAYPIRIVGAVTVGVVLTLGGVLLGGPIGGVILVVGLIITGIALGARFQRL